MRVTFKNLFFGPDGNRYKKDIEHELPDDWKNRLPKGAKVREDAPESAPELDLFSGDDDDDDAAKTKKAAAKKSA